MEELNFYKDNVDPADMTPFKKPTTEQEPLLKFKLTDDTKQIDFILSDSSKQSIISASTTRKRAIDGMDTNGALYMWCAITKY